MLYTAFYLKIILFIKKKHKIIFFFPKKLLLQFHFRSLHHPLVKHKRSVSSYGAPIRLAHRLLPFWSSTHSCFSTHRVSIDLNYFPWKVTRSMSFSSCMIRSCIKIKRFHWIAMFFGFFANFRFALKLIKVSITIWSLWW